MLTSGTDLDCFVMLPNKNLLSFQVILGDKLNYVKFSMIKNLYPFAMIK